MKAAELQSLTTRLKKKVNAGELLTDNEITIVSLLVHIGLMNKRMINDTKDCMDKLNAISEEIGNVS